jgi:hypothetical protein
MTDPRFERALRAFHALSAGDPEHLADGRPRELVQAERLAAWIDELEPHASEALRLAAHCQHLGRYLVPRSTYPEGRIGYLKWRADLAKSHAQRSSEILRQAGYDNDTIEAVQRINLKQQMRLNPDVQTMEDALCLAFLEHELGEFAEKHDDQKLIEILTKTWRKMSPRAHEVAIRLPLSGRPAELVARALATLEQP